MPEPWTPGCVHASYLPNFERFAFVLSRIPQTPELLERKAHVLQARFLNEHLFKTLHHQDTLRFVDYHFLHLWILQHLHSCNCCDGLDRVNALSCRFHDNSFRWDGGSILATPGPLYDLPPTLTHDPEHDLRYRLAVQRLQHKNDLWVANHPGDQAVEPTVDHPTEDQAVEPTVDHPAEDQAATTVEAPSIEDRAHSPEDQAATTVEASSIEDRAHLPEDEAATTVEAPSIEDRAHLPEDEAADPTVRHPPEDEAADPTVRHPPEDEAADPTVRHLPEDEAADPTVRHLPEDEAPTTTVKAAPTVDQAAIATTEDQAAIAPTGDQAPAAPSPFADDSELIGSPPNDIDHLFDLDLPPQRLKRPSYDHYQPLKRSKKDLSHVLFNVALLADFLQSHAPTFFRRSDHAVPGFVRLGGSDLHLADQTLLQWRHGKFKNKTVYSSPAETWSQHPRTILQLRDNFNLTRLSFLPNPISFEAELEKQFYNGDFLAAINGHSISLNFFKVQRYAFIGAWHKLQPL